MTDHSDIDKLRGDIHHLVSPIIGTLRLAEHHNDPTWVMNHIGHTIDRLYLVLNLMDEAALGIEVPQEQRNAHGLGIGRYPSLVDSEASPCHGGPHSANKED